MTAGMKGDELGWYTRLIMHHYDKGSLPDNVEELASLANVRFSEYPRFEQAFEQVLKHLFKQTEGNRIINLDTVEILTARENFKDKKSEAGKMSWFVRYLEKNLTKDKKLLNFIKENTEISEIVDENNKVFEQVFEQVFNQKVELYINIDKDTDTTKNNPVLNLIDKNLVLENIGKYKTNFENDYRLDETVVSECKFSVEQLATARTEFWNTKGLDEQMLGQPYFQLQQHFIRWCRTNKERIKKHVGETKTQVAVDSFSDLEQKFGKV